jgi:signal transduction histidine kinase
VLAQAGCSVQFSAASPVVGRWDRLRLEQVVTNLLSNAMKYGAGKPIEVVVEGNGERARLAVRDHGLGISETAQRRIFGAFERAVSERHYGGLGLGLYIARQLVVAHGGSIRVESKPGLGATFTVELSLSGPAPLPDDTKAVLGPTEGRAGIDRP